MFPGTLVSRILCSSNFFKTGLVICEVWHNDIFSYLQTTFLIASVFFIETKAEGFRKFQRKTSRYFTFFKAIINVKMIAFFSVDPAIGAVVDPILACGALLPGRNLEGV